MFKPQIVVPITVSTAMFMQQLDSTAVATGLPAMSRSLGVTPVALHVAITSYLFALAIFLPLSGWAAERFGQRAVFRWAIAIFTAGSILCALTSSLSFLVAARIIQGFGGAMMVPVARLILVNAVEKADLIPAMALMSMTAVIGPAAGPLLGGAITSFASWRWIFWINVPFGIVGILAASVFIREVKSPDPSRFDARGFLLTAGGFGGVMYWIDAVSSRTQGSHAGVAAYAALAAGIVLFAAYVAHARTAPRPILDLNVFRAPAFTISLIGGTICRFGFGALPYLLPLLLQDVFGYTPLQSGAVTFIAAAGSFGMRTVVRRVLRRLGFRRVLVWNAILSNAFLLLCAFFTPGTPQVLMMANLFAAGLFRALQFTSLTALSFADVERENMSDASTFQQIGLRLSQSIGVAFAAFVLGTLTPRGGHVPLHAFSMTFVLVAVGSAASALFFVRLAPDAGAEISQNEGRRVEA